MFGVEHLISVLRGGDNQKIQKFNHQKVSTFGIGKDLSATQWRATHRQLLALGLVAIDTERFNRWFVTEAGWRVLQKQDTVTLRVEIPEKLSKTKRPSYAANPVENKNPGVLDVLKARRLELARERKQPAYVIFTDKSLIDMANRLPKTMDEMSEIHGVGEKKLSQFGEEFLQLIQQAAD